MAVLSCGRHCYEEVAGEKGVLHPIACKLIDKASTFLDYNFGTSCTGIADGRLANKDEILLVMGGLYILNNSCVRLAIVVSQALWISTQYIGCH